MSFFHKKLLDAIVEELKETFSREELATKSLSAKNGYGLLDTDKVDLLKQRVCIQHGASRDDWKLVLPHVKGRLREYRKKIEEYFSNEKWVIWEI